MDNILEVKKLKISFRTLNGTVKAVREISFDLQRGETLAIVGESGSGKSVTSKAILGILAGNSIVEGGEILYDGKDLLKVSEEDMHKIRGDKIAMIFQDPLSSLDPIVKIGKQITEAMLLKNKANRRAGRVEFNACLAALKANIDAAMGETEGAETSAKVKEFIETFDKFNIEAITLENHYNASHTAAEELIAAIEEFLFRVEKKQKMDVKLVLGGISKKLRTVKDPYLTAKYDAVLEKSAARLAEEKKQLRAKLASFGNNENNAEGAETASRVYGSTVAALDELKETLKEVISQTRTFSASGFICIKIPTPSSTPRAGA